jgi:hypothetical protein
VWLAWQDRGFVTVRMLYVMFARGMPLSQDAIAEVIETLRTHDFYRPCACRKFHPRR